MLSGKRHQTAQLGPDRAVQRFDLTAMKGNSRKIQRGQRLQGTRPIPNTSEREGAVAG